MRKDIPGYFGSLQAFLNLDQSHINGTLHYLLLITEERAYCIAELSNFNSLETPWNPKCSSSAEGKSRYKFQALLKWFEAKCSCINVAVCHNGMDSGIILDERVSVLTFQRVSSSEMSYILCKNNSFAGQYCHFYLKLFWNLLIFFS